MLNCIKSVKEGRIKIYFLSLGNHYAALRFDSVNANLLFVGGHFGQRQEDHGELLPRDLAVLIVAHAL